MNRLSFYLLGILLLFTLASCGPSKPDPRSHGQFLTLGDVIGKTSFKEDSPDIRVINVKAKAFIKRNDIRAAKQKAIQIAGKKAVDIMVQELMTTENYNKNYKDIETYFSKNINKYIADSEVNNEKRIYQGNFYGIAASFKINRQTVLVALQKDLKLIDTSMNTLITVITSKKDLDLSGINFKFQDIESALMNQIQTDLNQRGLRAMDFRNAVVSMQSDETKKKQFEKISKEQFMSMLSNDKTGETALNKQSRDAEEFYSTGLSLLKQLARVVVEINILTVSKSNGNMAMSMNVTAKNISTGTGGAFANAVIPIARRGGPNTDDAMMLTGLIGDAYGEINDKFIPQIIKEMSTIDTKGNKLVAYELVLKGFDGRESRKIRKMIQGEENDNFRYIDHDNTLSTVIPPMNILFVRFSGKSSQLSDNIMGVLDDAGVAVDEPIVAPGTTDIVFSKIEE